MRIKLKLKLNSQKNIILKKGYSSVIQAVIYSLFNESSAEWLHENGFILKNRSFKLFCFSDILERGKYNSNTKEFIYPSQISFYISSPINWMLEEIAKNSIKNEINFGNNSVQLASIEIEPVKKITETKIRINALTPIEVHSTLEKKDGTKKTYYYSPMEKEFSEFINNNLKKKWELCFKEQCDENIKIYPVNPKYNKEQIRKFKGTIIKGWSGHFYLEGNNQLMQLALDTGLGSRNSAGFGMINIVEKK